MFLPKNITLDVKIYFTIFLFLLVFFVVLIIISSLDVTYSIKLKTAPVPDDINDNYNMSIGLLITIILLIIFFIIMILIIVYMPYNTFNLPHGVISNPSNLNSTYYNPTPTPKESGNLIQYPMDIRSAASTNPTLESIQYTNSNYDMPNIGIPTYKSPSVF